MHELKKLELIREEKQQLNEVVFLAALPWLIGAGMNAYDYYKLREKNKGESLPWKWDKASQLELGAGAAGTVAGGVLGRYLGKGIGWAMGKGLGAAKGAGKGAAAAVKAGKQAKKAAEKIKKTPDTAAPRSLAKGQTARRTKGGQFTKGSNVPVAPKVGAAIGTGAKAGVSGALKFGKAGKRLGRIGAAAGVVGGSIAGKKLGALAGLYGQTSDGDGKGASGEKKSDWWTSQQRKHKTGTRDATSSIPKPIPKPEFAHKYPKLAK
jgi:hypothetical protein